MPSNRPPSRLDDIIKRGSLRVGMTGDYLPFTYLDKEHDKNSAGFDVDMAEALGKALGVIRSTARGGNGTNAHMSSSSTRTTSATRSRARLFVLSDTSTLSLCNCATTSSRSPAASTGIAPTSACATPPRASGS